MMPGKILKMGVCDYVDCVHNVDGAQECVADIKQEHIIPYDNGYRKWTVSDTKSYLIDSENSYRTKEYLCKIGDFSEFIEEAMAIVDSGWLEAVDTITGEKRWHKFHYNCSDWDFIDDGKYLGYHTSTNLDLTSTWKVIETAHPWLQSMLDTGHEIWVRNWTPLAYNQLKGKFDLVGLLYTAEKLDIGSDDMSLGELHTLVYTKLQQLEAERWWPRKKLKPKLKALS